MNFTSTVKQLDTHSEPQESLVLPRTEVDEHKEKVLQASKQSQSKTDQEVLLHLWDCGGQLVFLDVLPAFLSSRTMFLLMFDASKGLAAPVRDVAFDDGQLHDQGALEVNTLSLLHKWMALIHSRFGGAKAKTIPDYPRMFLVGTHFDQLAPGQSRREKREEAAKILFKALPYIKEKAYANMVIGREVVDNTTAGKGSLADSGLRNFKMKSTTLFMISSQLKLQSVGFTFARSCNSTLRRGSQSYSSMKCTALLNSAMCLAMKFPVLFYSTMTLEYSCSILILKVLSL